MKKIILGFIFGAFCSTLHAQVKQDAFNSTRQKVGGGNSSAFNQGRVSNFNDYRQKLNAEYVSKTREKWNSFNSFRGILEPDRNDKPVTPIKMSEDDAQREKKDNRLNIESVVTPIRNNNMPQPIAPVKETPENNPQYTSFTYWGTSLQVRKPQNGKITLAGTNENAVADAWDKLCDPQFNNMVVDCLKLRSSLKLCDWAYLLMLKEFANSYYGANTNEATLLMAYIFSQSGYKMRLGQYNGKLEMLYASQHCIYNTPYFECDGDRFFPLSGKTGEIQINAAKYPKEQSLSLWVSNEPQLSFSASPVRTLTSKRYPEMSIQTSVNMNLIAFFNTYPSSEVGGNFMTRWAMYANTPVSQEIRNNMYPQLRNLIKGHSQLDAVERLLSWVQTGFVYEYDDKVWGQDRAFFSEESLYYPYCDCEDRSILLTRLVRDLLGLKCVLVYYPGHLASAIEFTEGNVKGDYIQLNGHKYVIADATYINAPVGATMPKMNNSGAKVILLD